MLKRMRQKFAAKPLKRVEISAIGLVIIVTIITLSVVVASAISVYTVTIQDGEQTISVSTRKSEPSEILQQEGIELGANDLLDTTGFVQGEDSQLTIYRACTATLDDCGSHSQIVACKNVEYTLMLNAVAVGPNDLINPPFDKPVHEGMIITLVRAFKLPVFADGVMSEIQTVPCTVHEALQKAGIILDADDETVPESQTLLSAGSEVKVLRVEYVQRTVKEAIAFEKTTSKSQDLYIGETKIAQKGANGEKTVVYSDKIVDGVLDSTAVVSQTVTKEAVPQKTLVGTKVKVQAVKFQNGLSPISDLTLPADIKLDANGIPLNYTRIVDGTATAYSANSSAKTASGRTVAEGHIAVDPRQFPYGTRLYVVTLDGKYLYGYSIAADTGLFVNMDTGPTIDVFFDTTAQCNQFGRRDVRIYVLD